VHRGAFWPWRPGRGISHPRAPNGQVSVLLDSDPVKVAGAKKSSRVLSAAIVRGFVDLKSNIQVSVLLDSDVKVAGATKIK
jgi:hypothetical protein